MSTQFHQLTLLLFWMTLLKIVMGECTYNENFNTLHCRGSLADELEGAFRSHQIIHSIGCQKCDVGQVETSFFAECQTRDLIMVVNISAVAYKSELSDGAFDELSSLNYLNLYKFNIRKLSRNMFGPLVNLQYLFLRNNRISSIDAMAFSQLPALQKLDISSNRIRSLHGLVFEGAVSLQYINIAKNKMHYIQSHVFQNLSELKTVIARRNQLTHFNFNDFRELQHIEGIDLEYNYLFNPNIPQIIAEMPSLKYFSVAGHTVWICSTLTNYLTHFLRDNARIKTRCSATDVVTELRRKHRAIRLSRMKFEEIGVVGRGVDGGEPDRCWDETVFGVPCLRKWRDCVRSDGPKRIHDQGFRRFSDVIQTPKPVLAQIRSKFNTIGSKISDVFG